MGTSLSSQKLVFSERQGEMHVVLVLHNTGMVKLIIAVSALIRQQK